MREKGTSLARVAVPPLYSPLAPPAAQAALATARLEVPVPACHAASSWHSRLMLSLAEHDCSPGLRR